MGCCGNGGGGTRAGQEQKYRVTYSDGRPAEDFQTPVEANAAAYVAGGVVTVVWVGSD